MRITKKLLALLMCLTMMLQLCVPAFAAGGATNLSYEITKTTAEVGNEIKLTISNGDMTASGIKAGFYFDNTKLEVTKITWGAITAYSEEDEDDRTNYATSTTSKKKANTDGSALGVYAINRGVDSECYEGTIVTVTFKAIAEGEAKITLREESTGTDAFKSDEIEGVTITIGSGEPEPPAHTCTPAPVAGQAASCETDGWKDYYQCSDATCGKLYADAAGKDEITDLAAWKAGAGKIPAGHSYGELIDATPEVHTQTELKGAVAAHFYCPVCKTYFTENKAATTLAALTGETPAHADVDPKDHKCDVCKLEMNMDQHEDSATDGDHKCDYCGEEDPSFRHIGGTAYCNAQPVCSDCGQPYGQTNPENHASEKVTYKNVTDTTHDVYYACCDTLKTPAEGHTYVDGKCACEKVQTFTVTWVKEDGTTIVDSETVVYGASATKNPTVPAKEGYTGKWDKSVTNVTADMTITAVYEVNSYTLTVYGVGGAIKLNQQVPYGTNVYELIKDLDGGYEDINVDDQIGKNKFVCWLVNGNPVDETLTMPAENLNITPDKAFSGWWKPEYLGGWGYFVKDQLQKTGWTEIDGSWYYLDKETGVRAEGLKRVPYPTEVINGKTYAPNAADVAMWEANADSKYTDAETAVFVFGTDGKFQQVTGLISGKHYAKDGMIGWHPGLVELSDGYYYFVGDKSDAKLGNVVANGDIYVTRLNGSDDFEQNGVYNFKNGKLSGLSGIVDDIVDGSPVKKYYENSKLMTGKGLTKVGDKYIFVRTAGVLALGEYWVTAEKTNGYCDPGMYDFGTDGFMVTAPDGTINGLVNGVYYKNGMPYYAGLIEIDGDMYYVKSNGEVATGTYYVTKVNDTGFDKGAKLVFGEDGKMKPVKNGICEENGDLYYYENNKLMRGAGVVKLTDEDGDTFYIYVRSNGKLATGFYWPTNRNGYLDRGAYNWGTDGRYYPAK